MVQSWETTFNMNIIEFLNIMVYMKEKAAYEKAQMEEYKRINHLK